MPDVGWLFTGVGGTRHLARSLMLHYDINPDDHSEIVTELADVIGEELLSVTRHLLAEHGLEVS